MDGASLYYAVIAGDGRRWALPIRGALRLASAGYRVGLSVRNRRYDRDPSSAVRLPVPVISVGNITTGGTGKTPLVVHLARGLLDRGRRPAVLLRGYKSTARHDADELVLVRRSVPEAICIANPDRVAAAGQAISECGADGLVLDDGFQHRRVARDLDMVVIDGTCPFGYGHVLPRGLLREPLAQLRRASLFVVSRADQVEGEALTRIDATLSRYAPGVPRIRSFHRPVGLVNLDGSDAGVTPGAVGPAFCFAAIGNPGAFRNTVARMGISVVGVRWWPDHHRYDEADVPALAEAARRAHAAALITTEKDAVKLADAPFRLPCPVYAVRIEIDFLDDGDTILSAAIDRVLSQMPEAD